MSQELLATLIVIFLTFVFTSWAIYNHEHSGLAQARLSCISQHGFWDSYSQTCHFKDVP